MRALIPGSAGLIGTALRAQAPAGVEVIGLDLPDLDITDAAAVQRAIDYYQPDVVLNAAGYLAVDKAERPTASEVMRVNADGPRHLAQAMAHGTARMMHLSTNYVFSGRSSVPYQPGDPAEPVSMYGVSKRDGEVAVLQMLGERAVVVRTSWVHAAHGNSFLRTILKVLKERGTARVVDDQLGTPTSAESITGMLWRAALDPAIGGIHHWTDAGVASWYDFAVADRRGSRGARVAAGVRDRRPGFDGRVSDGSGAAGLRRDGQAGHDRGAGRLAAALASQRSQNDRGDRARLALLITGGAS